MSRFAALIAPFVALLVACAPASTADLERKHQHEPFVNPRVSDGAICDVSISEASRRIAAAAKTAGADVTQSPADADATAMWNANGADGARAITLRSEKLPDSPSQRRLRIDAAPVDNSRCVAVRVSEECGPDLAPVGDPRAWHSCGDPASGAFLKAKNSLLEALGVSATEND